MNELKKLCTCGEATCTNKCLTFDFEQKRQRVFKQLADLIVEWKQQGISVVAITAWIHVAALELAARIGITEESALQFVRNQYAKGFN